MILKYNYGKKQAKENVQNRKKAAKNKLYLQTVNQLKRKVFNLDNV